MDRKSESLIKAEGFTSAQGFVTTRKGGVSEGEYSSFNLGLHVGDDERTVLKNRLKLEKLIGKKIVWMNQTHSDKVVMAGPYDAVSARAMLSGTEALSLGLEADGVVTTHKGIALGVLTADCLPLLLAAEDGSVAAAVHCGWKGLQKGIITNAVTLMRRHSSAPLEAFIGPCIGPDSFEVGSEVRKLFEQSVEGAESQFTPEENGKYLCSLNGLCSIILKRLGVLKVTDSAIDTFESTSDFFSYRRSHVTGRLASIIYLK